MRRLVTLVALALLPLVATARSTDTSHQVINLSAGEDDATTAWRDYHAKLAVSGDDVHVLWVAQPSIGGSQRLMYARSTDGGLSFEAPRTLAPLDQDPQLEATSLTLAVDGSSVYAVYHEGWPVNLRFTRSLDRGQTWETPRALATHHGITRHVVVAAQGGKVAVAWNLTMDDAPRTQAVAVDVSLNGGADFTRREVVSTTDVYRVYLQDILYRGSDLYVLYSDADVNWFSSPAHLYLAASHDDGASFSPRQRVSVDSSNGSDYAWGVHDAAYSPAMALCDGALVITWMNNDNPGGWDGWFQPSLRVRRSVDGGLTLASPTTLHGFPGSYQNGSHPQLETVACAGGHAVVATVLNDGTGEWTRFWESTDSGESWSAGRDLHPGGWWPSLHFAADGALHLFNGGHGLLAGPAGALHGTTAYLPTHFWQWTSPMTAVDAQGRAHVVGHGQTIFGDNYSSDVIYRGLRAPPAPLAQDQALHLAKAGDGRRDQMQVGATTQLPGSGAFSVELWVKPGYDPASDYRFIKKHRVDYDTGSAGYDGTFEIMAWGTAANRSLRAGIATDPYTWLWAPALDDGVWAHLALVYDPAAGSACARLYVDGLLTASGDTCGAVQQDLRHLTLGDDSYYASGSVELDDVLIWNVARSAEEIAHDMVHGATGAETGLAAYWSLDGTTRDLTGHGHDGVLLYLETFVTSTCTHAPPSPADAGPADAAAVDTAAADVAVADALPDVTVVTTDSAVAGDAAPGSDRVADQDGSSAADGGGTIDSGFDADASEPQDCACRGAAAPPMWAAAAFLLAAWQRRRRSV